MGADHNPSGQNQRFAHLPLHRGGFWGIPLFHKIRKDLTKPGVEHLSNHINIPDAFSLI
jgi:hypothetical protein